MKKVVEMKKVFEMQMISIWKSPRKKNTYISPHFHNYYELVYYKYGNGKTSIGDNSYIFTDNSFAVIPANVSHDELHFCDAEVICLEFATTINLPVSLVKDNLGTIYKILSDVISESVNQKYCYKEMISAKLNELCLYILRHDNPCVDEKNFEYIINYIKENYHEKIILTDCAKQLNISYDYFQHKFKELMGYSPQQFLIKQRLLASEKMLQQGNLSCTEIAYRCGFSTSAQYSALFKKEYKITPLQYKKNVRN
jgi:AraC-like DNA-binding protein